MNKIGTKIPPWGTPKFTGNNGHSALPKDTFQTISVKCFEKPKYSSLFNNIFYQGNQTPWKGLRILPMCILPYQMLNICLLLLSGRLVQLNILAWIQIENYWSSCALPISYMQTHNFFYYFTHGWKDRNRSIIKN